MTKILVALWYDPPYKHLFLKSMQSASTVMLAKVPQVMFSLQQVTRVLCMA